MLISSQRLEDSRSTRRSRSSPWRTNMRKLPAALIAATVLVSAGFAPSFGNAMPLDTNGIRAAAQDVAVTEEAHCVPGWWHHYWRPHDGCYRFYPYYRVRPLFVRPHHYWGWRGQRWY